jgi:hypothetical protein
MRLAAPLSDKFFQMYKPSASYDSTKLVIFELTAANAG